jgi:hypothetical protein
MAKESVTYVVCMGEFCMTCKEKGKSIIYLPISPSPHLGDIGEIHTSPFGDIGEIHTSPFGDIGEIHTSPFGDIGEIHTSPFGDIGRYHLPIWVTLVTSGRYDLPIW